MLCELRYCDSVDNFLPLVSFPYYAKSMHTRESTAIKNMHAKTHYYFHICDCVVDNYLIKTGVTQSLHTVTKSVLGHDLDSHPSKILTSQC